MTKAFGSQIRFSATRETPLKRARERERETVRVDFFVSLSTFSKEYEQIRRSILSRLDVLYEDDSVVREWEEFFEYALCAPRPSCDCALRERALLAREVLAVRGDCEVQRAFAVACALPERAQAGPALSWGYARHAAWGWQLLAAAEATNVPLVQSVAFDPKVFAYMVKLAHPCPFTGAVANFVAGVTPTQDAADVACALAEHMAAEPVFERAASERDVGYSPFGEGNSFELGIWTLFFSR